MRPVASDEDPVSGGQGRGEDNLIIRIRQRRGLSQGDLARWAKGCEQRRHCLRRYTGWFGEPRGRIARRSAIHPTVIVVSARDAIDGCAF